MSITRKYFLACFLGISIFAFLSLAGCCSPFFTNIPEPDAEPGKAVQKNIDKANEVGCKAKLKEIDVGLAGYENEYGTYPNTLDELIPYYLPKIPNEQHGGQYSYDSSTGIVTCSLGHKFEY